jgi:transcriptional regulator with XRE-family HTH domain
MDIRDVGAELRAAREARGLSIDQLAKRTRVQPRYLNAIEHNDIALIPPRPFGRGFVRAYATEVGLDPEVTSRDYFGRFAPLTIAPEAPPAPSAADLTEERSGPWALLAIAAATIAVVALLTLGRDGEPTSVVSAVGTSGTPSSDAIPAPGPVAGNGAAEAAADASAAPASRRLMVILDVSRPCWVTATADGQRAIYALLQPGVREKLTATREIVIRAGDAGALTWSINGKDSGSFGAPGEVRTVRVTDDGVAVVR